MKKVLIMLSLTALGVSHTYADIGIVNEITYTNHSFTVTGNDATFPVSSEADITLTVQNANTAVPANAVWVYLKFPCQQFWQPKGVVSVPAGFVLLDSLVSGNETILKFGNNVALPAPETLPVQYKFVVRGLAVASSEAYSGDGSFQGNFANMEYWDGIIKQGTAITRNALDGITKKAIVKAEPMPVRFSGFSVYKQQHSSLLKWNTLSEKNNKGFDIERSTDGKSFKTIGHQKSAAVNGNSTTQIEYAFTDNQPVTGNNYYRLRQVDFDGMATFSEVKKVTFDGSAIGIQLFPNPAHEQLTIDCGLADKVVVHNILGQQVEAPIQFVDGRYKVNTTALPSGSYLIQIVNGTAQSTHKVVVKHP